MIKGYLDNAATTETKFFAKDYYVMGNPNSPTAIGRQANEALEEAKQRIKNCLGVKNGEVLFCRCASEAIKKLNGCFSGEICGSSYEHDSVSKICEWYTKDIRDYFNYIKDIREQNNLDFLYLNQYVNQITGTVYDIENIGKRCRKNNVYFGSDFTAAIGHISMPKNLEAFCDIVWFSGHKFHAEQGIGAIWLSNHFLNSTDLLCTNINALFEGTPNVSGAIAMSYAMEHAINKFEQDCLWNKYYNFIEHLNRGLKKNNITPMFIEYEKNWDKASMSCVYTSAINSIVLPGINADALVQYCSAHGVYISAGHSACAEHDDFHTLEAFGLTKEEAEQTIRVSFCEDTTIEDINALVECIKNFKEQFI